MRHIILTLSLVLLAAPAFAHEVAKGPNGGPVSDAGDYHVELVPKTGSVDVFVTDAKDQPVAGAKGIAILLVEGKQQRVVLEGTEAGKLAGKLGSAAVPQAKGVVQLTLPQGGTVQARFK